MRIDRINLSVDTDGKTGKVRSASIYFENVTDLGERVSGQFAITLEEYEKIQREELLPETIAERKLVELFAIRPEEDVTSAFVQLSEQLAQKDQQIAMLQQMIVELALMLSMLEQPGIPGEPEDPPAEEPTDPDIPPEEGAPDDPEPETPADPVADGPDTTPIDEGGEGGE